MDVQEYIAIIASLLAILCSIFSLCFYVKKAKNSAVDDAIKIQEIKNDINLLSAKDKELEKSNEEIKQEIKV